MDFYRTIEAYISRMEKDRRAINQPTISYTLAASIAHDSLIYIS